MRGAPPPKEAENLAKRLARRIASSGPIRMDEYMRTVLMDEEAGYYQRRAALGAKGDFLTAPETSQVFGEIVGLWFAALWRQTGSPAPFLFAEMGAGKGTLMRDALRAIAQAAPDFLKGGRRFSLWKKALVLKRLKRGQSLARSFGSLFRRFPKRRFSSSPMSFLTRSRSGSSSENKTRSMSAISPRRRKTASRRSFSPPPRR